MKSIARLFLGLFFAIIAVVVLAQITGCAPQYREAPREVAEEFRFQEARAHL